MILKEKRSYIFHALKEGNFETETGETKTYFTALVFPIKEDGTVEAEQVKLKVDKNAVASLKMVKQGERIVLEIGAFVKEKDFRVYAVSNDDLFE